MSGIAEDGAVRRLWAQIPVDHRPAGTKAGFADLTNSDHFPWGGYTSGTPLIETLNSQLCGIRTDPVDRAVDPLAGSETYDGEHHDVVVGHRHT